MQILYDENGIPIFPGDTIRIFHFTSATRRKKYYMYKFVVGSEVHRDSLYLRISHLNLNGDSYLELLNGRVMTGWEIVQGYEGLPPGEYDFRSRERRAG
jgi:hypothetical protein